MKAFVRILFIIVIILLISVDTYSQTNGTNANIQNAAKNASDGIIEASTIKSDFLVNSTDSPVGAKKTSPYAACDSSGNMAVVWIDGRNGVKDIYIQFYNSAKQPIGNNIRVNESNTNWISTLSVALNNRNECVVVWFENSSRFKCQRFYNFGTKKGNNIELKSFYYNQSNISSSFITSASLNDAGYFMLAFIFYSQYNKMSQAGELYNSDGDRIDCGIIGSYLMSEGFPPQYYKGNSVVDKNGNFFLAWVEESSGRSNLKGSILKSKNSYYNDSFYIIDSSYFKKSNPSVAVADNGNYFVGWTLIDNIKSKNFIKGRILDNEGKAISNEFDFGEGTLINVTSNRKESYSLLYEKNGELWISTLNFVSGNKIESGKIDLQIPFSNYSYEICLPEGRDSSYNISFCSSQPNKPDVYIQRIIKNKTAGELIKANDDKASSYQVTPVISKGKKGNYVIMWNDLRNGGDDIYARFFDGNHNALSGDVKIDTSLLRFAVSKKAVSLSDGNYLIAYLCNGSNGGLILRLCKFSPDGKLLKTAFFSNFSPYYNCAKLSLCEDKNNDIMVLFSSNNCYNNYVYTLKFSSDLVFVKGPVEYLKPPVNLTKSIMAASLFGENKLLIVFSKYDSVLGVTDGYIRGVIYNSDGKVEKDTFNIAKVPESSWIDFTDLKVTANGDIAILCYSYNQCYLIRKYTSLLNANITNFGQDLGYIGSPRILEFDNKKLFMEFMRYGNFYGQFFNDNNMSSTLYRNVISRDENWFYNSFEDGYSYALLDDNLVFVYESKKNGSTGFDIWCNVQKFPNVQFKSEYYYGVPNQDVLYNNYPNPFNSTTKIPFYILSYHKVKLAVYDILGREVKVLVDKGLEKGFYEVEWNSNDFPSGVYFCRLEAFNTTVKKIVVVR